MELKPGSRWRSDVCEAEVVVVRPPNTAESLACGGHAMKPATEPRTNSLTPSGGGDAPLVGKRYADETSGLEVLCNKAGKGSLSFGGRTLAMREAKKLPSSD